MNALNNLGINYSVDYAKYQSIKGTSGDLADFLIHYDSQAAQSGDESWMNSLFGTNDLLDSIPPQMLSQLDSKTIQNIANSATNSDNNGISLLDNQVSALKLQLVDAFKQRYEKDASLSEEQKTAKVADLYTQVQNFALPSRFI
jgi:hypothetical protein